VGEKPQSSLHNKPAINVFLKMKNMQLIVQTASGTVEEG
jgi:hypothetical protein